MLPAKATHRQSSTTRQAASAPASTPTQLDAELVKMLAQQGRRVPIPIFLAACLIASMANEHLPLWLVTAWLGMASLTLLWRYHHLGRLQTSSMPLAQQLRMAILLSGVSGLSHGLSLGFFVFLPEFERAVQSIMLVGLCAGSVATTAGFLPAFLAYLLPTLLPLSILWLAAPSVAPFWLTGSVALLIALLAIILIALSKDSYQLLKASFESRQQQIQLNQRLQLALDSAESANRAKTRFLASASHDLRQPLQSLSMFAASLARRPLDERSSQIVHYIHEAVQMLNTELDALLDISKLDADIIRPNLEIFSLTSLLNRLHTSYQPLATDKGLYLRLDCPADLYLKSDRQLFERIVRNLLDNAIKYTLQGQIELRIQAEDQALWLCIQDTGPGIDPSEQANIFEEFYQIDNPERDRQQGLGLGLAIVQRLSRLLQLPLRLQSSPGLGSSFFLGLPISPPPPSPAPVASAKASNATARILLVDDEPQVRLSLQQLLESLGFIVLLADSSDSACQQLLTQPVDLVISDLRLRGEDSGIQCIAGLRQLQPDLAALLLSGDTAPQRLQQADQAGIPLLHKPISAELLLQAIQHSLHPA